MLKRFLILLAFHLMIQQLPAISQESANNKGIQFDETLSWPQILSKAKSENKFVFLDCFATWCGPCKLMDKNVYPNDTVGSYFNQNFISVRIQMDKTKKDNDHVQSWYQDAATLFKQYRIQGFPSLIFLSPRGTIVHKVLGFQSVNELLLAAQTATKPGQVYNDPFAQYDSLVADYKNGIKHYDKMPYMIKTAYQLQENALGKELLDLHTEYVAQLPKEQRYTKENIEMWAGFLLGSDKKRFWFFYNDGDMIDKIMDKKGYAMGVVNRTIQEEIVWPFIKEQSAGAKVVVSKETMNLLDPNQKPDFSQADWKKLYQIIRKKYNKTYTEANVLEAKIKWYDRHKNYNASARVKLEMFEKNPPDITDRPNIWMINELGWHTFLNTTDKKLVNGALIWMEKVINYWKDSTALGPQIIDTYANLLYKTGKRDDAILWEQKALFVAEKNPDLKSIAQEFKASIEKMKIGEPTYIDAGAIWAR